VAPFRVTRFEIFESSGELSLARVEGSSRAMARDAPELLVTAEGVVERIPPLPAPRAAGDAPAATWTAGYAVPTSLLTAREARFALATNEPLPVPLPAPVLTRAPAGALHRIHRSLRGSSSVISTGLGLAGAQILLAIAGIMAARYLGPSGRGIATAVTTWAFVLTAVSLAGLNTAASVRVAKGDERDLRTTVANAVVYALGVGCIVALAGALVIPSIVSHLGPEAHTIALWAMTAVPISILAEILLSVQIALGRRKLFLMARWTHGIIVVVGTALLIALGALTPGWVVGITLGGGVLAAVVAARGLPWRLVRASVRELRSDIRFGARVAMTGWLAMANARLDYVLMSAFVPAAQIGYYGAANNVMLPVATLASAAATLATPAVARLGSHAKDAGPATQEQIDHIRREGTRTIALSTLGGLVLAALAPFMVPLLLGVAYTPAIVLIWILIPGYVIRAAGLVLAAGAAGLKVARVGVVAEGSALVVTLSLLPILLPAYHALGAAITSTCAYIVSGTAAYLSYRSLARGRVAPSRVAPIAAVRTPNADAA
jgi:O-antigen/teichoic acid export membrane protein